MRWILAAITVSMLLLGAVVIAGSALPRHHEVARAAVLEASRDAVFGVIADIEGMAAWRAEVREIQRLADRDGRPAFRETGVQGPVIYTVEEHRPPARMVLRVHGAGPGLEGTWTFELAPERGRTRLTITERGHIDNPIFRFLSRFVFGHATAVDGYLRALAQHLDQDTLRIE